MLRTTSRLRTRQPARRSKQNNRILRRRRARCLERNRTRQLYTRTNRTLSGNFLYATTGRCAGVGTQFAITTNRRPRVTARRNTAPCIAWAAYHIRALNPNANIVVAPSDHLILKEDEFLAAIEKGLDFVSRSEKLLTLGIKPNRPETGYGYIQIDEPAGENFYKVKTFTEKPELELAKVFVESGEFYWNSGLFMWNVNTIIKASEDLLPELASKLAPGKDIYATDKEKAFIEENFPACPNVSIDFGIMEKADNVYVSLGDFGWSDLGTWGSLYDLSERDPEGNVTLKCHSLIYNSKDNMVVLPKGKLAVIDGLEGFLIAESDNVLLICRKDEEHAIRKYVNDAQMQLGDDFI